MQMRSILLLGIAAAAGCGQGIVDGAPLEPLPGRPLDPPPPGANVLAIDKSEPNDEPADAMPLFDGDIVSGTLGGAGDRDWFVIEASGGYTARLELGAPDGCWSAIALQVFRVPIPGSVSCADAGADRVGCDEDDGAGQCPWLEVPFGEDGVYSILLTAPSTQTTLEWTMAVDLDEGHVP